MSSSSRRGGWSIGPGCLESCSARRRRPRSLIRRLAQSGRAIDALRRQEQSLFVRWRHANEKATPEQRLQHQAEVMARIVEHREAVERPAAAPRMSEGTKQVLRRMLAEAELDDDSDDDGGSAA